MHARMQEAGDAHSGCPMRHFNATSFHVPDRLSAFMQGLDACTLDNVPFAHDISSAFDVADAAISS